MKNNYCQLWLTCNDTVEADAIAQALLDEHLIACSKQTSVNSNYWWDGKKEHNEEVLLVMDSCEDLFEKVEAVVTKLHSYETPVLQAVPLLKLNKDAEAWLGKELA